MEERLKATYELIIENSKQGRLTTKKEIVENYPYDPQVRKDGYKWNDSPTSHDNCSTVWKDINDINLDGEHTEIIISHNGIYWVGTKEEAEGYIKHYFFSQCKPSLKRYWNLVKKGSQHDTVDIFTEEIKKAFIEG